MASFWSRKWGDFPRHEYNVWYSMVSRCCDRRNACFARYGGRGIRVCDRWRHDFMAFLSDMGPRPSAAYSLDRLDNDGDYAPENCRWATRYQQQHNKERMRNAVGVKRHGRWWRSQIRMGGRPVTLGSFEAFAEARRVYRQAALRNRIVAELSAAWAPRSGSPPHQSDDGSLDRRLLNLLLEASRSPGASGGRQPRPRRPGNLKTRGKPRPATRSRRSASAGRKPSARRS